MKKKHSRVLEKILVILAIILAIFFAGYLVLDKLVVPKYFSAYGINNIKDLSSIISSLYNTPKESKLVTHGYTTTDVDNAIIILQGANYDIDNDGKIDKDNFRGNGEITLTDKEFAGVCNKIFNNKEERILEQVLWNDNFKCLLDLSVLELVVTPHTEGVETESDKANLSFLIKMNAADICKTISEQMNTPKYLLNMIIPETLYFSVSYDFDFTKTEKARISNGKIAINGKSESESEVLIKLFIDFIFPKTENMTLQKFTDTFGNILLMGSDYLGTLKFEKNIGGQANVNGIKIIPQAS